ncbi:MAG TPA: hypothetical protein VGO66_12145 [Solirubrobacterales bacterium]|nr:hypothetical protein [Solirubrobacterales bacterium]
MKRHVKESSAGSISGWGRTRTALLTLALAALSLLALAPLSQAKIVVSGFGVQTIGANGEGALGTGEQVSPSGIAVNSSGAGGVAKGTVYLASGFLNRIQRFSSLGVFERAWGFNVVGHDERQRIAVTTGAKSTMSGSIAITVAGESMVIPVTASGEVSNAAVKSALEALPAVGAGNITVTGSLTSAVSDGAVSGGSFNIRFIAARGGTDIPPMSIDTSQLLGTPPIASSVTTLENGSGGSSAGFEICTVASQCKDGEALSTVANGGQLSESRGVAVNQSTGHVYVTETGNRRVSEFDADGNFIRAWGADVKGVNEVQTLVVDATAGQYKLSFGANPASANIAFNATAGAVTTALTAAAVGIGTGNVTTTLVTSGNVRTYTITFTGELAGTDVAQLVPSAGTTPLSGGVASATVTTKQIGVGGNFTGPEVCTVAAECKQGAASDAPGGFGQGTANYPVVDSAGNVWIPASNRVQEFTATGSFIKMVGGDVVDDGATGTGTLSTTSNTVTAVATTSRAFRAGQTITAAGGQIPAGTTIAQVGFGTLILSQKPTVAGTGVALTVAPGAENVPVNEKQTVTIQNATGGTFTLSFSTPNPSNTSATATAIPYNATGAEVEAKLAALSNIGAGNVAVTGAAGGPWTVEFKGTRFADTDVEQLAGNTSGLAGTPNPGTGLVTPAKISFSSANGSEVCSIAADCRAAAFGTATGQFGSVEQTGPTRVALDAAGNLYAIDKPNSRVQKFNSSLGSPSAFAASTFAAFTANPPAEVISTQGGSRLLFAVNNNVTASPNEAQLLEIDPSDASLKETSLVGSGLSNAGTGNAGTGDVVSGLAANADTGDVYLTTTFTGSPRKVLQLSIALPADPSMTMDPVTVKGDTTATFSGTVNPKVAWVSCKFQYSTDQVNWTDVPEPDCDNLIPNGGSQAISQNATGLNPGSSYFVRLAVSRPFATGSTKTSLAKAFDTAGAAPGFGAIGITGVQDTSARIVASIEPRNSPTGYVIQYGTTPALGSATDPVDIGGGTTPVLISKLVEGLKPNTTYYLKIQATNLAGTATSAGQSFKTRAEALPLPGGRSYEQVSPVEKNFGGVDFTVVPAATAAPDGEAVGFCTASGLSDDGQVTGACSNYLSRRGSEGWGTRSLHPPVCTPQSFLDRPASVPTGNFDYAFLSMPIQGDDCPLPPLDPAAPTTGSGYALYRQDLRSNPFDFDLITPLALSAVISLENSPRRASSSFDGSHLVFTDSAQQTPDAPAGSFEKIFEWQEGTLSLVSKSTANAPLATGSAIGPQQTNGISTNGDRIFFQNPVTGVVSACDSASCELYLRENATTTHWVSQQECTVACSNTSAPDVFEWATPSGSKAFFRSAAKLNDEDTQGGLDLYRYTQSASPNTDKNLTLISKDNEPADGSIADVRGVLGASDDGDTVYFAAFGQLVLGKPIDNGPKLYRWRWNGGSPSVEYLATLRPRHLSVSPLTGQEFLGGDEDLWEGEDYGFPRIRFATPDGKYLVLQTGVQLDPIVDRDSTFDVYRWGQQEGWSCASCQPPGAPSSGLAKIDAINLRKYVTVGLGNYGSLNSQLRNVMSDDGQRVFFTAHDALVPQDENGAVEDLYEWHEGTISLVSSGRDVREVLLIDASPSGRDVFFMTFDPLVGWDVDKNSDIYDARIGGGFPEPPATGAPCEGEACRGASGSASPGSGAGTAVFQGAGNPASETSACPKGKVRRHGQCVKKPTRKHAKKHAKQAGKRAKHSQRRASR